MSILSISYIPDFLGLLWPGRQLDISGVFRVSRINSSMLSEMASKLRINCTNPLLLNWFLTELPSNSAESGNVCLVGVSRGGEGAEAESLESFRVPNPRHLLRFALQHPIAFRAAAVVLPVLYDRSFIVALSPNSGHPHLSATPLATLGELSASEAQKIKVLALKPLPTRQW